MLISFPVPKSFAETFNTPSAFISNVTSIWGTPRGAGGIPSRLKLPKLILSLAIARSPWSTCIVTAVCISAAVLNILFCFVGIVVFLSMILVNTPPSVSTPRLKGVTSSSTISSISPANTAPCILAPIATHSIGSIPRSIFFPTMFSTVCWTRGIFVIPPNSISLSILSGESPASRIVLIMGFLIFSTIGIAICSSFALVIVKCRFCGPSLLIAM